MGQSYGDKRTPVRSLRLDSLRLDRIDFIKLDVEGMEIEALEGAAGSIERCRPILTIEIIKTDSNKLRERLNRWGYRIFQLDRINIAAVHESDPGLRHIKAG
jgi:hypothetical protein